MNKIHVVDAEIETVIPEPVHYIGMYRMDCDQEYYSTVSNMNLEKVTTHLQEMEGVNKFILKFKVPKEVILEDKNEPTV